MSPRRLSVWQEVAAKLKQTVDQTNKAMTTSSRNFGYILKPTSTVYSSKKGLHGSKKHTQRGYQLKNLINELQCLLCVNHGCAEQKLLLLLFLLPSFLIWRENTTKQSFSCGEDVSLCSHVIHWFHTCQTWINNRLWRTSRSIIQLQQCLLYGLAEGVLEAGNGDPVRAVALPVAVCCWRSEQLICWSKTQGVTSGRLQGVQQEHTTTENRFYRKYTTKHGAPVISPAWSANGSNTYRNVFDWKQQLNKPFNKQTAVQLEFVYCCKVSSSDPS